MDTDKKPGFTSYLFHPATIPEGLISLAVLIFFSLLLVLRSSVPAWLMPSFLVFVCFMHGLSGVIMLIGAEYASPDGRLTRGWRASLRGSFQILIGWGFLAFLVVQWIKK